MRSRRGGTELKRCNFSIQIGLGFFAVLALSIYYGNAALAFMAAAAIHELGHIAAIVFVEGASAEIEFKASGIYIIRRTSSFSTKKELLILLSGPIAGGVAAMAAGDRFSAFSDISRLFSIINLLPIKGTDGGGAVSLICPNCLDGVKNTVFLLVSVAVIILHSVFIEGRLNVLMLFAVVMIYLKGILCDDKYI